MEKGGSFLERKLRNQLPPSSVSSKRVVEEGMGRDVNDDRRRALVKGKFKFLYQDDTEDIEATDKFNLAVVQNKLLGN